MGFGSGELLLGITSLIGVGLGVGLCFVPAMTAVQVTCQKCPAVAGGLAAAGIGAGILIEPPLVQGVIHYLGWRAAFQIMSVIAMCGAFAALLLSNSASTNRSGKSVISSPRLPHLEAAFKDGSLPLLYMASA